MGFSSQYSPTSWAATQALGPSNTFSYGDISTSWTATSTNGTLEYLTVGFAVPTSSTGVTIRETWGNGFVYQVDAVDTNDVLHTVFAGVDPSLPGSPVDFDVAWPATPYLVKGVKIYVDTNHNLGTWEEIDSVALHPVAATRPYHQTAGSTQLDNGHLVFDAVDIQGGSLSGTGVLDANLTNAGAPIRAIRLAA